MSFIEQADFAYQIKQNNLNAILEQDVTILPTAISAAVSRVKNYLFKGYDTASIFAATGTDRNADLMAHCINIAIYFVYKRVPTARVPEHVREDYRETILLLEKVATGEILMDLPLKQVEGEDVVLGFSHTSAPARGQ